MLVGQLFTFRNVFREIRNYEAQKGGSFVTKFQDIVDRLDMLITDLQEWVSHVTRREYKYLRKTPRWMSFTVLQSSVRALKGIFAYANPVWSVQIL